jgi:hypothetical protein
MDDFKTMNEAYDEAFGVIDPKPVSFAFPSVLDHQVE